MAATQNDAVTFVRIEIFDSIVGEHVQSILDLYVRSRQSIKSDGLTIFNLVKVMEHMHISEVVYPKQGTPKYDALQWVNILVPNTKAFTLCTYLGVMKKHSKRYLQAFCYRFNRQCCESQGLFGSLLACANVNTT